MLSDATPVSLICQQCFANFLDAIIEQRSFEGAPIGTLVSSCNHCVNWSKTVSLPCRDGRFRETADLGVVTVPFVIMNAYRQSEDNQKMVCYAENDKIERR